MCNILYLIILQDIDIKSSTIWRKKYMRIQNYRVKNTPPVLTEDYTMHSKNRC